MKLFQKTNKAAGSIRLPSKEKLRPLLKNAAVQLAAVGVSALMQGVSLTESVSPVGLALVAGVNKKYALATAIGFMIGALARGPVENSIYISAAAVASLARFVLLKKQRDPRRTLLAATTAAVLTLFISRLSVMALSHTVGFEGIMLALCELLLIVAMSIFFFVSTAYIGKRSASVPAAHKICIYICIFCGSVALCSFSIGFVSIGRALLYALLMLMCAQSPSFAIGCAAFVSAAIVTAEPPFYFAAAGCMAASVCAVCFRRYSKLIFALSFLICGYAAALIASNITFALIYICELSAAAAIFILIPSSFAARVIPSAEHETISGAIASSRLSALALSFGEISSLLEKICTVIPRHEMTENLVSRTADSVCRGCSLMSFCWVKHYGDTVSAMMRLADAARKKGRVTPDDMPAEIRGNCINPMSVCNQITRGSDALRVAAVRDRNTALYRTVLYRQFRSVGKMLGETERTLSSMNGIDPRGDARIKAAALDLGIPVGKLQTACIDGRLRSAVSFTSTPTTEQRRLLVSKLSQLQGARMSEAQSTVSDFGMAIEYCETPLYRLETDSFQNTPHRDCGDSYSIFDDCNGQSHIVLADGMGTGRAAALDSAVCCAFMRRLLENGFDGESGARLVNAAMAIRDEGESAVTVDCLAFDGYRGRARLLKAGAAPTYILRRGELTAHCQPTLPVGIMDEVCAETDEITLSEGDIAVMLTDGALESCGAPIADVIRKNRDRSAPEILSAIVGICADSAAARDDVTVIVAKVALAE